MFTLLTVCRFKTQGRVKKSWMMLTQAIQLGRDIALFDTPAELQTNMSPELERVRTITAWGLFNLSL